MFATGIDLSWNPEMKVGFAVLKIVNPRVQEETEQKKICSKDFCWLDRYQMTFGEAE